MSLTPAAARLLADLILLIHFGVVAFIVGGVIAVWIGACRGWRWVRNGWFRLTHATATGIVAIQAVAGVWCPLTVWEWELRRAGGDGSAPESFIHHWIGRILFFDLPEIVFTIGYVLFLGLALWTWRAVRPRFSRRTEP